ncbi:MAG: hypothetical protein L3K04_03045 [Thermoplasmata archaeon]|nr:hypothetical protein [Thermoplasmata archaeon]
MEAASTPGRWVMLQHRRPAAGLLILLAVGSMAMFFTPPGAIAVHMGGHAAPQLRTAGTSLATPATSAGPSVGTPSANIAGLTLGITASPSRICAFDSATCPAGTGQSHVTMTAVAGLQGLETWPAVQVAFVIETTLFDGVYDPSAGDAGTDPCADTGSFPTGMPCEESNGVPFFVAHAQQIANAIQSANPHSVVSFSLVDYFATLDTFDDGDGSEYNVDIPTFVPAAEFGAQVQGTFQAQELGGGYVYSDSDFSDNILHSSSITALYGAIVGSGLDWSPDVHHVVVWMGSTVPRDPSYSANYCVTASDYAGFGSGACASPSCEPGHSYGALGSPNCEGWVRSPDQNISHSIAGLARTAAQCTNSIGGVCTIDTIDLYDGMTDACSKDWPVQSSSVGPCKSPEQGDAGKVIEAGCDLAAATGGSWDGPNFASCPDGQQGTLLPVFDTNAFAPNTQNPTLLAALRGVSFGPVIDTTVANGTGKPLFTYVPFGHIELAPAPQFHSSCTFASGAPAHCPATPKQLYTPNGAVYYGWNWSNNSTTNVMHIGDAWSVTFYVDANGPPYSTVPVDACVTAYCKAGGSGSEGGVYTWASYIPVTNKSIVTESFPLAQLTVLAAEAPVPPPPVPPAAPPPPPPFAVPVGPPIAVGTPVGVGAQVGLGSVALQGVAAGFLAAGFLRVGMKNRPIAMAMAAKSGVNPTSLFEKGQMEANRPGLGRFD